MSGPRESLGLDGVTRRQLLKGGAVATVGVTSTAIGYALLDDHQSCPEPSLDDPQPYETQELSVPDELRERNRLSEGAVLITSEDDVRDGWFAPTMNYDETYAILIVVEAGGGPSPLSVLGVDQDGPNHVKVYTCWSAGGYTGELAYLWKLVTVPHDGDLPDDVTLQNARVERTLPDI
ncbi:hypothetical protein ACLI4Z_01805 [Natrialbaceae archaeon A-arb3/5]